MNKELPVFICGNCLVMLSWFDDDSQCFEDDRLLKYKMKLERYDQAKGYKCVCPVCGWWYRVMDSEEKGKKFNIYFMDKQGSFKGYFCFKRRQIAMRQLKRYNYETNNVRCAVLLNRECKNYKINDDDSDLLKTFMRRCEVFL